MRGDTGEYSCSHGVCERITHARRVDKKVRKGPEKIQGTSSARISKAGMGYNEFRKAKSKRKKFRVVT